jgi:murein DD-endopeptidase MepM/ murein hydrolase activator NlpD
MANVQNEIHTKDSYSVILRCGQHYILYGHVSSELVQIGQNVTVGQPVAKSFGFRINPLAHLEVR